MLYAYVCSAFIVTYDLQGRSVSDLFVLSINVVCRLNPAPVASLA